MQKSELEPIKYQFPTLYILFNLVCYLVSLKAYQNLTGLLAVVQLDNRLYILLFWIIKLSYAKVRFLISISISQRSIHGQADIPYMPIFVS